MNTRSLVLTLALLGSVAGAPAALAQTPAPAAAADGFSTSTSTISELLANPAAKAVLDKHIPAIVSNPQIAQAGTMTLKGIQQYAADQLPDETLAKIDADLKAVKK